MQIGYIFGFLCYYFIFAVLFLSGVGYDNPLTDEGSVTYDLNTTSMVGAEFSILGVFGTIGSLFLYVFFGVGVLASSPLWLQFIFSGWQSILTIIFVLLLVNIITDFIP